MKTSPGSLSKLLVVTQFLKFGSARGIVNWIKGLRKTGRWEITLMVSAPLRGLGHDPGLVKEILEAGVSLRWFHSTFERTHWHAQALGKELRNYHQKGFFLQTHGGFAAFSAYREGLPFMHMIHGLGMNRPDWINRQDREGIQGARVLAGMSREALRQLTDLGVKNEKARVIPYVMELKIPGMPDFNGPFAWGMVGELVKLKGHEHALRALSELCHLPWKLRIVGDGPERKRLESLVQNLNLESRVEFAGFLPRFRLYEGLHGVLMPSLKETMGFVAVEALEEGVPVLAYQIGGLPEILRSGRGAVLVKPNSLALKQGIADFMIRHRQLAARVRDGVLHARELLDENRNIALMEKALYDLK